MGLKIRGDDKVLNFQIPVYILHSQTNILPLPLQDNEEKVGYKRTEKAPDSGSIKGDSVQDEVLDGKIGWSGYVKSIHQIVSSSYLFPD